MKNSRKSKPLLSKFIDFIFIVLFITVTILTVSVTKAILYPEEKTIGELKIRSELMPREYKDSLAPGDVLFDTVTKRRVGEISRVEIREADGKICFYLTLNARFKPRSKALRSNELWFYFAVEDA